MNVTFQRKDGEYRNCCNWKHETFYE